MSPAPCLPALCRTCRTVCAMSTAPGQCTDTLTCTNRPAKCNGASASATAAPAACRLQLHLQPPGKTCLSPSEASSAGQTDPIDSTRLGSTRLDLSQPEAPQCPDHYPYAAADALPPVHLATATARPAILPSCYHLLVRCAKEARGGCNLSLFIHEIAFACALLLCVSDLPDRPRPNHQINPTISPAQPSTDTTVTSWAFIYQG